MLDSFSKLPMSRVELLDCGKAEALSGIADSCYFRFRFAMEHGEGICGPIIAEIDRRRHGAGA